jgi:hypothetical protein
LLASFDPVSFHFTLQHGSSNDPTEYLQINPGECLHGNGVGSVDIGSQQRGSHCEIQKLIFYDPNLKSCVYIKDWLLK